jgi:hypothetical protein
MCNSYIVDYLIYKLLIIVLSSAAHSYRTDQDR